MRSIKMRFRQNDGITISYVQFRSRIVLVIVHAIGNSIEYEYRCAEYEYDRVR